VGRLTDAETVSARGRGPGDDPAAGDAAAPAGGVPPWTVNRCTGC